jgi:xanthine dehydrogenase YagR molybdenum-binding subunit
MKFNEAAGPNPIDRGKVVGVPTSRIDGPAKTTGTAPYAYERHDVAANPAYGWVVGSAIAKGRIASMDVSDAQKAPGVLAVVSALDHPATGKGTGNNVSLFGGPTIEHYHKAIAVVVAETFEQARAAAALIRTDYQRADGTFDLAKAAGPSPFAGDDADTTRVGDFEGAFASAPVKVDSIYTTPDESHAMMEPHATIAAWEGDKLTLWTSNQMIAWSKQSFGKILGIDPTNVRVDSPFIGGGFGGKLFVRADAVCAALGAKAANRPVKIALQRPLMINNTTHRHATRQRVRIGADSDGRIVAIAHEGVSGNLFGEDGENAVMQTQLLYAGANRYTSNRVTRLDLPEGNAMRAPGEAVGHLGLEVAMDELAEKLDMCPVKLRIMNDTQVDPENPDVPFSQRNFIKCFDVGAQRFGWPTGGKFPKPAMRREGDLLIGIGVAAGIRGNPQQKSGARVRLGTNGKVMVETDMTDIGTGSYTIIGQTAAEMMGVPLKDVTVKLGDSDFPASAGSGGQWGANNSTAGTYAACVKLREQIAQRLGYDPADTEFEDGMVRSGNRSVSLAEAAGAGELVGEDHIEYGDIRKRYQHSTFAAHFAEVAVDAYTGETHIRRMLSVCDAGRILNPKSARSQVIGAMVMSAGATFMEELAVDKRFGFFVNHDLAGYEVPVHADIPHQDVVFLEEVDPLSSPMKAKGVGELGICGPGAALANAVYNATGIRVREYPITLDKLIDQLPAVA